MKSKILFLVLLSLSALQLVAQWKNIGIPDLKANGQIKCSEWADSLTLYGHEGSDEIFISRDGGNTFIRKNPGIYTLAGISHVSTDTGYIISRFYNRIYKTNNAWDSVFPILITDGIDTAYQNNLISFIHFWDSKHGMVVGDSTEGCLQIWTTENGGEFWTKKACDTNISIHLVNKLYASQFGNFQETGSGGWFTLSRENNIIFRIENYGKSWTKITLPTYLNFTGNFAFKNDQEGIVSRSTKKDPNYTFLAKTTDGSSTWDTTERILIRILDLRYFKNTGTNTLDGFYLFGVGFFHYDFSSGKYTQIDSLMHSSPNFYNGNIGVSFFSKDLSGNCVRVFQPNWLSLPEQKVSNSDALAIYPNPSKGKISFSAYVDAPIIISGVQGQQLFQGKMDPLDLSIQSGLSPGLYFLRIEGTGVSEIIVVE